MGIITSILLGAIEGVTEFLPISSTGHLILFSKLLRIPATEFSKSFEIFIQLGAILAVVALYWRRLLANKEVLTRVIVAFIPTGIIGLVFYRLVKTHLLGNSLVVLISLFVGGLILIAFELWHRSDKATIDEVEKISLKQAIALGFCQSIAIIPGVSRAAVTIIGGLALGLKRETIVEFSFLLAVPTMLAAAGFDLLKSAPASLNEFGLLAAGFSASFLTAILAIKFFLGYIQKHDFIYFGIYRIIIALILGWVFFA